MGSLLLFVHILAAGAWLGANFTQGVVTPAMRKNGGAAAAAWMRQAARMGRVLNTPAAVILLITGVWMVIRESVYEFEQAFVTIGIFTVVVGAVLGMRVFGPGARAVAELHDSDEEAAAAVAHKRLAMFGIIETALVIFTIWAMVERLGL